MPTVLITGGTGLVGKHLTNALVMKGYKVIILTRSATPAKLPENGSYAHWDLQKKEIDPEAIKKADHIIHLAGAGVVAKKWTGAYKKEILDSRTESSRLIIEALMHNPNSVKAIVSASAIGWYGPDTLLGKAFIESDPADLHFLGQTCRLWEESMAPVTTLGKRLVKLRMGIVLGNDGGALAEFKKPLRFGIAAILGTGQQVVSWIHIDDLCRLFMYAIENEDLRGSYNAVSPCPVSNKTLTLTLAKAMQGKFYIPLHVPAFMLKIMLGERSVEVLKSATVSSKKIQDAGFTFTYNNIEPALKNLVRK